MARLLGISAILLQDSGIIILRFEAESLSSVTYLEQQGTRPLFGRMVGDGGLTVFTTRCSSRVVKGLVDYGVSSGGAASMSGSTWPQYAQKK